MSLGVVVTDRSSVHQLSISASDPGAQFLGRHDAYYSTRMRAHLSNGGIDVVLEVVDGALVIRYWGKKITSDFATYPINQSVPNSDFDEVQNPGVAREHSRGFLGYPMIAGHRNGSDWSTRFSVMKIDANKSDAKIGRAHV